MRNDELEKMTVKELRELRIGVDKAIAARQNDERHSLRDRFKQMAEQAGFSLAEILGGARGGKGRSAAVKFANPDNPVETWSGRGRQPRWLSAKLKSGSKLDDFRI